MIINGESVDIRLLEADDYDKGFIELMSLMNEEHHDLSVIERAIGSKEDFTSRVDKMNGNFNISVIEYDGKIIATCTIIFEYQRHCSTLQHLMGKDHSFLSDSTFDGEWDTKTVGFGESMIVDLDYRRQGLSKELYAHNIELTRKRKCYKIIANSQYPAHLENFGFKETYNLPNDEYVKPEVCVERPSDGYLEYINNE